MMPASFMQMMTNNLNDIVNSELTSLKSWFKANELTLNTHKTNVILFNPYHKHFFFG